MINKDITVDINSETKRFNHFFRATGYVNADYTYTQAVRRMYDCLESYEGYPLYIRMHYILTLHGRGDHYILNEGNDYGNPMRDESGDLDIVVKMEGDTPEFNWEPVDRVYDIIIAHGMHPIVETLYMPSAIADKTRFAKRYYLPKNFRLWEEVIEQFTRHCVSRYGLDEVRKWYFEIYNEPENNPLWKTDPSSLFALYDYLEYAVHNVDPGLRTGGPAVGQYENGIRLYEAFLRHCSNDVNYKTGSYGARVDFISVHCKGGQPSQAGPSIDYMFDPLRKFVEIKKEFPEYDNTEFFNDESDIVWDGNKGISSKSWLNFRNTHYAPGFTAKMIHTYCSVLEDELAVNLGIVASDNNHLLWEKSFFFGSRSQFTPLGKYPSTALLRKPIFNIFPLLGKLGSERYLLKSNDPEYGEKYGVLGTKDGENGYSFLVWNFEDGLEEGVNERNIRLHIKNLDRSIVFDCLHFRIDDKHSSAYAAWCGMGRPFPLSREQAKELLKHDGPEFFEKPWTLSGKSELDMEFKLPMHSTSLFLLVKKDGKGTTDRCEKEKPVLACEKGPLDNEMVFVKWSFSKRRDLVGYRIYRRKENAQPEIINEPEFTHCSYYYDLDVARGVSYAYSIAALYADGSQSSLSPESIISIR